MSLPSSSEYTEILSSIKYPSKNRQVSQWLLSYMSISTSNLCRVIVSVKKAEFGNGSAFWTCLLNLPHLLFLTFFFSSWVVVWFYNTLDNPNLTALNWAKLTHRPSNWVSTTFKNPFCYHFCVNTSILSIGLNMNSVCLWVVAIWCESKHFSGFTMYCIFQSISEPPATLYMRQAESFKRK